MLCFLFPCHDCQEAGGSDWFLLIVNIDDTDDEYDKYENCDTFGDYNADTLAEINHVEQEALAIGEYFRFMYVKSFLIHFSAGSSTLQQLTTPLVPSDTPPEMASLFDLPVRSAGQVGLFLVMELGMSGHQKKYLSPVVVLSWHSRNYK